MTYYMKTKRAIASNFDDVAKKWALKDQYTGEEYNGSASPKDAARMAYEEAISAAADMELSHNALIERLRILGFINNIQRQKLNAFNTDKAAECECDFRKQLDNIIYDNDYYNYEYGRN